MVGLPWWQRDYVGGASGFALQVFVTALCLVLIHMLQKTLFLLSSSRGDALTRATYASLLQLSTDGVEVLRLLCGNGNSFLGTQVQQVEGVRLYKRRLVFLLSFSVCTIVLYMIILWASAIRVVQTSENGSQLQLLMNNITVVDIPTPRHECTAIKPKLRRSDIYAGNHRLCVTTTTVMPLNLSTLGVLSSDRLLTIGVLTKSTQSSILLLTQRRLDVIFVSLQNTGEDGVEYAMSNPGWQSNHITLKHLLRTALGQRFSPACGTVTVEEELNETDNGILLSMGITNCSFSESDISLPFIQSLVFANAVVEPSSAASVHAVLNYGSVASIVLRQNTTTKQDIPIGRGRWANEYGFRLNYIVLTIFVISWSIVSAVINLCFPRVRVAGLARAYLASQYEKPGVVDELHDHPERTNQELELASGPNHEPSLILRQG